MTKGRLVLEVVKHYVGNHPGISASELRAIFPNKIQGMGVFTTEEDAREIISKPSPSHASAPECMPFPSNEPLALPSVELSKDWNLLPRSKGYAVFAFPMVIFRSIGGSQRRRVVDDRLLLFGTMTYFVAVGF